MPRCSSRLAATALLLVCALPAAAHGAEPVIPAPRGFVNDFGGVIDAQTTAHLERLIGQLRARTGAEIAVVTVASTEGLSAFDYAMKVSEQWRPGRRDRDNGVVFLVAVKDRALHILTGYGVEGALPDGRVGEIRDQDVLPRFRAGDYAGGIRAGTETMARIIAAEHGVTLDLPPAAPPRRRSQPRAVDAAIGLFVIVIFLLVVTRSGLWPLLFLPRPRGGLFGGGFGGGGFGGGGGGFGGFGGGGFGGGGAGGRW